MRLALSTVGLLTLSVNIFASPITFATFSQTEGGRGVSWDQTTSTFRTITADNQVLGTFQFNQSGISAALPSALTSGPLEAYLTAVKVNNSTATCVQVLAGPNNCVQPMNGLEDNVTTYFRITLVTPFVYGGNSYSNLLTVAYTGRLNGTKGSNLASIDADTALGDTVNYTSDFLDFSDTVGRSHILSLSSVDPAVATVGGTAVSLPPITLETGGTFRSFQATIQGQFNADPSAGVSDAFVPEPTSFLLIGSAMVGLGLLRRARRS